MIYANTASVAQISKSVADGLSQSLRILGRENFYLTEYQTLEASRLDVAKLVAHLLDVESRNIALQTSTSEGLAKALVSLGLDEKQTIAYAKAAFPSVGAVVKAIQSDGVNVIELGDEDGIVTMKELTTLNLLPTVLVLEWVNFRSGCVNDIDSISRWCFSNNVILVVDAVQGLGAVTLDFDLSRVSFLACGGHKWLGGIEGAGFLYVSDAMLQRTRVTLAGYSTLDDWLNPRKALLSQGIKKFETGTLSNLSFLALRLALEELFVNGVQQQTRKIHELSEATIDVLHRSKTVIVVTKRTHGDFSGIVSFIPLETTVSDALQSLRNERVIAKERHGVVRLSPSSRTNTEPYLSSLKTALKTMNSSKGACA